MYCQYQRLKGRITIKCFEQACYRDTSAKPGTGFYCARHIQSLPRKTKLELLIDVIDFPPDASASYSENLPTSTIVRPATVNDETVQSSAESVTSISSSNKCCSDNEHNRKPEAGLSYINSKSKVDRNRFERPFKNLGELCECYGYLPRPKTWRMLPLGVPGMINALPLSNGIAIATNGVHVAIENTACSALYIGHLEWFVVDDLNAPACAKEILQSSATDILKVARNQLKQFDELFL